MNVFDKYLQPSVEILSLRIDEPITTATDLLLAAVCFYAFYRIRRLEYTGKVKWYFKYYFLTLGLGAMFGGLFGHAFLYRLAPQWKLLSWILTMVSVLLMAHALMEVVKPIIKPGVSRLISRINLLILAVALFATLWTLAFSPVLYYTVFGMIVVVGSLCFYYFQKTGSRGVLVMMGAIGVGLISAVVASFGWGLSPWFNHNDISHVILTVSAFNLYKGAALVMASI